MTVSFCAWNEKGTAKIVNEQPQGGVAISASVGAGGVNRKDDVLAVQQLLNQASSIVGSPRQPIAADGLVGPKTIAAIREFQSTQLGFSDGRVDPNHKTIGRLNVLIAASSRSPRLTLGFAIPAGAATGVSAVGAPAAGTAVKMTPLQAAIEATPRAILLVTAASVQLRGLLAGLNLSGGLIFIPTTFDMVNTHFHLDRSPNDLTANLGKLIRNYGLILQMLGDPGKFYQEGAAITSPPNKVSVFADAAMGGFHLPEPKNHITFRTQYPDCGPNTRTAMLIHEGAHFVGGVNEINHFAMEFPSPNGQPQGQGNTRNYAELLTDEALKNASSYAAFAIHAGFLRDLRFGAGDITQ